MHIPKHIKLLLTALLTSAFLHAQYMPRQGESVQFSYGYAMLLQAPEELQQTFSDAWQLQFMNEVLLGNKNHFSLGYGLGFSQFNWRSNLRITTSPGAEELNYSYLATDSIYNKNRLLATYVDLPIEIRWRSNTNKYGRYWRFYFGGLVGYRMNTSSLFKVDDYSVKNYGISDVANVHYGVFVRTGFWMFNLYAYYGINPVFKSAAPGWEDLQDMRSLTLGLTISI